MLRQLRHVGDTEATCPMPMKWAPLTSGFQHVCHAIWYQFSVTNRTMCFTGITLRGWVSWTLALWHVLFIQSVLQQTLCYLLLCDTSCSYSLCCNKPCVIKSTIERTQLSQHLLLEWCWAVLQFKCNHIQRSTSHSSVYNMCNANLSNEDKKHEFYIVSK